MKSTVHEVWRSNPIHFNWLGYFLLWGWAIMALQAQAATYSLPASIGSGPFSSCSLVSGTSYRCTAAVGLSNNDTVSLTSSLTMNVINNGFTAGNNVTINSNGFHFLITATEDVNIGNGFIGEVSITASGKTINIGKNAQVTGNLTAGTLNIGSGSVINGACTPANSRCTGAILPTGTFFPVPIATGLLNQDITTWSGGSIYSPYMNGSQTLRGVPFTMQTSASGMNVVWGTSTSVFSVTAGRTYTNTVTLNTNLYGATKVYALINSAWGNAGSTVGSITFNASNGDSHTVALVEGVNVRDHYYGGFVNTVSAGYVTKDVIGTAGSGPHLDMQAFALPASFATEILSSIVFTATGSNSTGLPFLAGTTVDADRFGIDHVRLDHAGSGLTCTASTVTVTACQSPDSSGSCTASTLGISGNVYATNATGTFATKAFTIPSGSSATTVTIADPTAETLTLSAGAYSIIPSNPSTTFSCWNSASGSASCSHTYSNAGFIFSSAANGGAATIPAQVAGASSGTYYLRAVKTNTTTKACEAALAGSNSVSFGYECNNPATCASTDLMTINGSNSVVVARNNNGTVSNYATVGMLFDANGNAPFTFNFGDVGLVTLHARKAAGGGLQSSLTGASNAFVVAPHHFDLAVAAAAPITAGSNFSTTVTARSQSGLATPNFGKEASPVPVAVTSTNPVPAMGNATAINTSFMDFSEGQSTQNLIWREVGTIDLAANVSDYLGSGLDATGSLSSVGRFKPAYFKTTVTQGCVAGEFTYSGQPFNVTTTAYEASGAVTANYAGAAWAKPVTLAAVTTAAGALTNGAVAATEFSSGISQHGTTTYTFTSPRTVPASPVIRATDTDGVTSAGVTLGEDAVLIRSGRLVLRSAYGSELMPLTMSVEAQFWREGGNTAITTDDDWTANPKDSCTSLQSAGVTFDGASYRGNLNAGETAFSPVGPYLLTAGRAGVTLSRPGAGNNGSVDVIVNHATAGVPWFGPNETARATFGLRKTPIIYMRENF